MRGTRGKSRSGEGERAWEGENREQEQPGEDRGSVRQGWPEVRLRHKGRGG